MKLSTKGRYGLRAMVDLAANSHNEHVALYSIAKRQNVSGNYLEQVFSILKKVGLVNSIKGSQGGYLLADEPSKIKVGAILRALEGELSVADEECDGSSEFKHSIKYCLKQNVWDKINDSVNEIVDSITLEDLVNDYKNYSQNNTEESLMFFI
jgi:Rrf2 family protein